jgi:hypothetical protein
MVLFIWTQDAQSLMYCNETDKAIPQSLIPGVFHLTPKVHFAFF